MANLISLTQPISWTTLLVSKTSDLSCSGEMFYHLARGMTMCLSSCQVLFFIFLFLARGMTSFKVSKVNI